MKDSYSTFKAKGINQSSLHRVEHDASFVRVNTEKQVSVFRIELSDRKIKFLNLNFACVCFRCLLPKIEIVPCKSEMTV